MGTLQKLNKAYMEVLPFESIAVHIRWCGREIDFELNTKYCKP